MKIHELDQKLLLAETHIMILTSVNISLQIKKI